MNVFVLNTMAAGLDNVAEIMRHVKISGIIGLQYRENTDAISDYIYQEPWCNQHDIPFITVEKYNLDSENDRKKITSLDIDVLLVLGWQRLIPSWLIEHCKIAAIGAHGSPLGITQGRGRSPQNWALMLGWDTFHVSIFNIDKGIDSGEIIDTAEFEYSPWDDIATSYYKVSLLVSHLIVKNIKSGNIARGKGIPQTGEAGYLPQRMPADGQIDWNRTSLEIYNFVRALTFPYPGAFSFMDGHKITIKRGIPFSIDLVGNYANGEIVKCFTRNDFLIKTGDHFFLVLDYDCETKPTEGLVLTSLDWNDNINGIVNRHQSKYPDLPVNKYILNLES